MVLLVSLSITWSIQYDKINLNDYIKYSWHIKWNGWRDTFIQYHLLVSEYYWLPNAILYLIPRTGRSNIFNIVGHMDTRSKVRGPHKIILFSKIMWDCDVGNGVKGSDNMKPGSFGTKTLSRDNSATEHFVFFLIHNTRISDAIMPFVTLLKYLYYRTDFFVRGLMGHKKSTCILYLHNPDL